MQLKYHAVTIEDLVPAGHFLRKLEHSCFRPVRQRHLARRWEPEYREALKKRQRPPLPQQKEFRSIKNAIIQEADNLRLGRVTFVNGNMDELR